MSFTSFRPCWIVLVMLYVVAVLAGGDVANEKRRRDLQSLQGEWRFDTLKIERVPTSLKKEWEKGWQGARLTFIDRKCEYQIVPGRRSSFEVSLGEMEGRWIMDLRSTSDENDISWLYDVDRQELRISYLPHAVPKKMEEGILVVFKRHKVATKSE